MPVVELLQPHHDRKGFDCGKPALNEFLQRQARQTEEAAREMGIYALVLDALDEEVRSWYLHLGFGFETLLDDPNHLLLPVSTIRQLGLSGPTTDGPASVS